MQHRSSLKALLFVGVGAVSACGVEEPEKFDSLLVPNLEDETARAGSTSTFGGSSNGGSSRGGTSGNSGKGGSSGASGGNDAGLYRDSEFGLEWRDLGRYPDPSAAATACAQASVAGRSGFRLPTIDELRSLIKGCSATALGGVCQVSSACSSSSGCRGYYCDGCGSSAGTCYASRQLTPNCGLAWSTTQGEDGYWGVDFQTAAVVPLTFASNVNAFCMRDSTGPAECAAPNIGTFVSVPAMSGLHTGYQVCAGQLLTFKAQGSWCWGGYTDCSSPDGTPGRPTSNELPVTMPGSYFGALIGRIGDSVFHIGSSKTVAAPASGELELLMNDRVNSYVDNTGELSVNIAAERP